MAVRVADAAVLSLTLLGDIAYGAGVVALCVPPAAELGSQLVSAGQKVLKARDALSQKACEGLGALQRALPFLAAANGAAVAAANGEGSGYAAMALLLPGEGSSIASGGLFMPETRVAFFGKPAVGTHLMLERPLREYRQNGSQDQNALR